LLSSVVSCSATISGKAAVHVGADGSPTGSGGAPTGPDGSYVPDAPPPVVLPCDSLGAVGKWEIISPPGVIGGGNLENSGVAAFVVDPLHSGTVYVGTDSGHGIWKTADCGATWAHVNTGRNGQDLDNGRNWTFVIDPFDSRTMFTNSGYGTNALYRSTDGGVNWDKVWPSSDPSQSVASNFVSTVQMDPGDPRHLIVTFHSDCSGQYAPGCFAETTNSGATWTIFGGSMFEGSARLYMLDGSNWIVPSNGALYRSTDRGATWKNVGNLEAGGHSGQEHVYRGKNGTYYLGTQSGVIKSTDGVQFSLINNSGSWVKGTTGNGDAIFGSGQGGVMRSSENNDSNWTLMPNSPSWVDGCVSGFDLGHQILYTSCGGGGFSRMLIAAGSSRPDAGTDMDASPRR
jgi:photosystem II stability/assembly factor-like uncharacterized protein